jgi:hypothetical protein
MKQEEIDNLIFEPIAEWNSHGNAYQRSQVIINKIPIYWTMCLPFSPFKEPWDNFVCDLIIPDATSLKNGKVVNWYEPEGFGLASFKVLEDAIEFCENYKHSNIL